MASDVVALAMRYAPVAIAEAHTFARQSIDKRIPPLLPGRIRAHWDTEMVARLKETWVKCNGNAYRVARELGITEDAAARAHKRFMVASAIPTTKEPRRKVKDWRLQVGAPSTAGRKTATAAHA